MANGAEGEAEAEREAERTAEAEAETTSSSREAVLDVEAATGDSSEDELRELVEEQQEQIEELNDLLTDMSARLADNGGMGVCPDCHGGVVKTGGFIRKSTIECSDCGRVFHEY